MEFPRRMMDVDQWMKPFELMGKLGGPTSLDVFDPFDQLDTLMGRNIDWIHKPDFVPVVPSVQQKYRITIDCPGFKPMKNAIKTEIKGNTLTVTGREEDKETSGDFSVREFKKTYELPKEAETDKMVSFMPMEGTLVVEVPLKEKTMHMNEDLLPKTIEGGKAVSLNFGVPENIDPSKILVSIKDRDLIVKADDTKKTQDGTSKFHYYKRTTMPANTDFDQLKVNWENHKLSCYAPLKAIGQPARNVPIQYKKVPITEK